MVELKIIHPQKRPKVIMKSPIHSGISSAHEFSYQNIIGISDSKEREYILPDIEELKPLEVKIDDVMEILTDMKMEFSNLRAEIQDGKTMRNMIIEVNDVLYNFPIWIEKEGDWFIAIIPDLDIASQGCTIIDAFENLKDLMMVYFDEKTIDAKKGKFKRYMVQDK